MADSGGYGRDVFIIDGARTPFLKARNGPGAFYAADLAVACGRPLLARQPFAADALDEVIIGCVGPTVDEANIGRIVALRLGCGERTPAWTVARNCASGMQALDSAATDIALGRADLVLAGGTEAMSHAPVVLKERMVRWLAHWSMAKSVGAKLKTLGQLRPAYLAPVIGLLRGLRDPVEGINMGQTAEKVSWMFNISRRQMDEFAVASHQRVAAGQDAGHFDKEIEAIFDSKGKAHELDDGLRRDSNVDKLAKLKPFFDKPAGQVTPGNSSQITDGASLLILASAEAVEKHDLPVLGKLIDTHWAALDPSIMGLGPALAMPPLLQHHGLSKDDVDYWEINEAFAGQVLACQAAWDDADWCKKELGLDTALERIPADKLNVDGGAVALGHPVGATGARLVLHLLHVLHREDARRGIASLCIGGGQGGAMLLERV